MLHVLLFSIQSICAIVSVDGFVPSVLASRQSMLKINTITNPPINLDNNSIYIVEFPNRFKYKQFEPPLCKFTSKLPEFDLLEKLKNERVHNKKSRVSLIKEVPGSYAILSKLLSHNITVSYFETNSTYMIVPKGSHMPNSHYKVKALMKTKLSFLSNLHSDFYVFSSSESDVTRYICSPEKYIKRSLDTAIIIFIIIVCSLFYMAYFKPVLIGFLPDIKVWISNQEFEVLFGPSFSTLDDITYFFLKKQMRICVYNQKTTITNTRVQRTKKTLIYERMAIFPLKFGKYLIVIWDEIIPQNESNDFALSYDDSQSEISSLSMKFKSFKEFRPIKLSFLNENNNACHAELPSTLFLSYQPYGQFLSISKLISDEYNSIIQQFTNSKSTIANPDELFDNFNLSILHHISANRVIMFYRDTGEVISQKASKDFNALSPETIKQQTEDLRNNNESDIFIKSFFINEPGTIYYAYVNNYCFLFSFNITIISITEEFGCPNASFYLLSLYQYIQCNYHQIVYSRFIESIAKLNRKFILIQYGSNSNILINHINSSTSREITTADEYRNEIRAMGFDELDSLLSDNQHLLNQGGGQINNYFFELKKENQRTKYLYINGSIDNDPIFNDYMVTYFIEDITDKKEQEIKLQKNKGMIINAITALKIHELTIEDKSVKLKDNSLYVELNRESEYSEGHSHLRNLVDPSDLHRIDKIAKGKLVVIHLMNNNKESITYCGASDGTSGMIYCVHNKNEIPRMVKRNEPGIQLNDSNAQVLLWTVDLLKDTVHQLFMQPTIWSVLSTYPENKFSSIVDIIHNDDQEMFIEGYHHLVSGQACQWVCDARLMRINGNYEWYRFFFILTQKRNTLHCLAFNVQKQKEIESKLESTQRLRDLLMSSGKFALWQFNDDYQPCSKMKRFKPGISIIVKMNWSFIDEQIRPDYRDAFKKKLEETFTYDKLLEIDVPLLLTDSQIWISLRGKRNQNNKKQIVGVCLDVTDLWNAYTVLEEEKKAAEIASEQKTVFLANMTHEIRTPLNVISGNLDILSTKNLSVQQKSLVELLQKASEQLMRVLDDTIHLSKIESGLVVINRNVINLTQLIEPICIPYAANAYSKKIQLNVIIDKNMPSYVITDSQLLMQIINNLLANALKFTSQGSITMKFEWVECMIDQFEKCIISVKDTGIGIPPEFKQRIFERFQQADPSVQRFYGGSGLGLALVYDICKALDGSIHVNSEVGKGSEFVCELPMESALFCYSPPFRDNKEHILMVSIDDKVLLASIEDWMAFHKYKVIRFTDPNEIEAVSGYENSKVDAVFVEGNRDNWETIKKVVNRIKISNRPVVCSISHAGEPISFDFNLTKPIIMTHFFSFVNSIRYKKLRLPDARQEKDAKQKDHSSTRILIVEDNKGNQKLMSRMMEYIGYQYEVADNGQAAIDKLDNNHFDFVFMDCQMPVLDGVEATKIIRRSNKTYSSIPIVALTASVIEGDETICREAGMNDYIAKPVRVKAIKEAIEKYT